MYRLWKTIMFSCSKPIDLMNIHDVNEQAKWPVQYANCLATKNASGRQTTHSHGILILANLFPFHIIHIMSNTTCYSHSHRISHRHAHRDCPGTHQQHLHKTQNLELRLIITWQGYWSSSAVVAVLTASITWRVRRNRTCLKLAHCRSRAPFRLLSSSRDIGAVMLTNSAVNDHSHTALLQTILQQWHKIKKAIWYSKGLQAQTCMQNVRINILKSGWRLGCNWNNISA